MLMFQGKLKTLFFMDITVSILVGFCFCFFFLFSFQIIEPLSQVMKALEIKLSYPFLVPSENIFYLQEPPKN